jgi:ABC-type uncharacterized transport system substrate-binding protein
MGYFHVLKDINADQGSGLAKATKLHRGLSVCIAHDYSPLFQRTAAACASLQRQCRRARWSATSQELAQVQTAARALGLESVVLEIRRAEDIAAAFEGVNDRAEALYVIGEALVNANIVQITRLALNARLPTVSRSREYVEAGCLMSYGAILSDLFRRAGDYVDKILHGAKPADLPVEQPTKFELLINLRTAKALGLTVPQMLIMR